MSSLIFSIDRDEALVVTDTLATTPDGVPCLFTSKAIYLPHLRLIIAGTGIGRFSDEWLVSVNTRMFVTGIEHLDYRAPAALRKIWETFSSEQSGLEGKTTTIYHFGVSEESGEMTGFAYRSANDFRSERLSGGTARKPYCDVPEGENLVQLIPGMMEDQRRRQAAAPVADRIYIGGQAMAIHLTPADCRTWCVFEFPDYRAQAREALRQSERNRVRELELGFILRPFVAGRYV